MALLHTVHSWIKTLNSENIFITYEWFSSVIFKAERILTTVTAILHEKFGVEESILGV